MREKDNNTEAYEMTSSVSREKEVWCHGENRLGRPLRGSDSWAEPLIKWEWATWTCVGRIFQAKTPKQTILGNEEWSEGDRAVMRGQTVWGLTGPGRHVATHSVWHGEAGGGGGEAGHGGCLWADLISVLTRFPCWYVAISHRKEQDKGRGDSSNPDRKWWCLGLRQ